MKKIITDAEEKLRSRECKLTPKRKRILKIILENNDKHLSAEEIYNLIKRETLDVGLATVYRTLELFSDLEIIHSIEFGDGRKRYEVLINPKEAHRHHHHHLICLNCGSITEVDVDLLEDLEKRVSKEYNFVVTNHQLKLFGRCKNCTFKKC